MNELTKKVYLDNNATTMLDPLAYEEMKPFLEEKYGNPNSLHNWGREVHVALNTAMDRLYDGLGADDEDDIVVVSNATESINWVLKGVYFDHILGKDKSHIITTQVEHPAVMATCRWLEGLGVEVTYLDVNAQGVVSADELQKALKEETALVSIMWANNETGAVFPIEELAKLAHQNGSLFHSDATQAVGKIKINLGASGVDFASFSAHKFHGPKGVGGLYIKNSQPLTPLFHGGSQMGGRRSGTLDVAHIVGMGKALEQSVAHIDFENSEVRRLRDKLEDALLAIPHVIVVGDRKKRTPNTILASVRGVEGEALIWDLNKQGIACSTGSACASEDLESNPIMEALGLDEDLSHTAIRLSLSRFTSEDDIDYAIKCMQNSIGRLREISNGF